MLLSGIKYNPMPRIRGIVQQHSTRILHTWAYPFLYAYAHKALLKNALEARQISTLLKAMQYSYSMCFALSLIRCFSFC